MGLPVCLILSSGFKRTKKKNQDYRIKTTLGLREEGKMDVNSAGRQLCSNQRIIITVPLLFNYSQPAINRLTLQHMWGTQPPPLTSSFWRKRNSFTTIDLFLVLRQVRHVNYVQQKGPAQGKGGEVAPFSPVSLLIWHCAKPVVFFCLLFFFCSFSWPSLNSAAWRHEKFYCAPSPRTTTRWDLHLKVGRQRNTTCVLMTAQDWCGVRWGREGAELVPNTPRQGLSCRSRSCSGRSTVI